jgi:hypothetical protein
MACSSANFTIIFSLFVFFFCGATALLGPARLIVEVSRSHSNTAHSLGLLWTRDRSVAETSTWQHTTFTRDKHPCPRRDSNQQSQHVSGRRTMPQTARPPGSAPLPSPLCIYYEAIAWQALWTWFLSGTWTGFRAVWRESKNIIIMTIIMMMKLLPPQPPPPITTITTTTSFHIVLTTFFQ